MKNAPRAKPHGQCGAKTRGGKACANPMGFKTDHVGEGRCHLHGGKTPVRSGRYSTVSRPRVRELLDQLAAEPDPMDLLPEAQLIRALLVDYVERYDELLDALLEWNEKEYSEASEENRKPRPQAVPALHEAAALAEKVAKVVGLIQQQKKEGSISLESFNRVMEQMGLTVARYVKDPTALRHIEAEWLAIQIV